MPTEDQLDITLESELEFKPIHIPSTLPNMEQNNPGPYMQYQQWCDELIRITAENTGQKEEDIIIGSGAALWYHDGFTPYQTFRETYQMENDGTE